MDRKNGILATEDNLNFSLFIKKMEECLNLFNTMKIHSRLKVWRRWQEMTNLIKSSIEHGLDVCQLSVRTISETKCHNKQPVVIEQDSIGTKPVEDVKCLDIHSMEIILIDEKNSSSAHEIIEKTAKNNEKNYVVKDLKMDSIIDNKSTLHASCKEEITVAKSETIKKRATKQNKVNKRKLICDICSTISSSQREYKRHMRTHSSEKNFECLVCSKKFANKNTLDVHSRIHTGEKPFSCTECSARFTQHVSLKNHLKLHSGEKPHVCEICGRAFVQKANLKLHKKRHLKVKDFKCDVCDRGFVSKSDMERHKLLHTGERRHLCWMCPLTFTRGSYLQEHINIKHTGAKPYSCKYCDECFADSCSLSRHTTKTHKKSENINSNVVLTENSGKQQDTAYNMYFQDSYNPQTISECEIHEAYIGQNDDLSVVSYLNPPSDIQLI